MHLIFALLLAAGVQKYEGKVTSWDAKSGKIHLTLTDQSTGDWTVLPNAKVFRDGKPTALAAIHAGEEVEVAVTPEGKVQTVWVIPPMWGKPFEGGKLKRWDGRITGFERHDPNFQFQIQQLNGTGTIHFIANAKTRWKRGHADASVDDAKQGQTVTVLLSPSDRQVTEVMIRE
jgi:hypothetical protein